MSREFGTAGEYLAKPMRTVKARKGLQSRKPMKHSNVARKAEKYARNFSGDCGHDDFIRSLPCVVGFMRDKRCRLRTEAAHVIGRGMGGARGTWRDICPLCSDCHKIADKAGGFESLGVAEGIDFSALSHALVVANSRAVIEEQLAAWNRLQELDLLSVGRMLDLLFRLLGYHVMPPEVA